MKHYSILYVSFFLLAFTTNLHGVEPNGTVAQQSTQASKTVEDLYPNIEMGFLNDAVVSNLPDGVLLRADNVIIESTKLNQTIADANKEIRKELNKYASLVLEEISIKKLLVLDIKNAAVKNNQAITETDDNKIIRNYIDNLSKTVKITDPEILKFYNDNKDSLGGAALAQIKPQIQEYLLQEKLQELINEKAKTIGQRMKIEVSASWLKTQAPLEKNNSVNKARDSGKPTMVDFGSKGCIPCEMLAPILKTLQEKYKGKANIVVVLTGEEPILASRYGADVIPLQIFYDKTGKEVFRHIGFYPQADIEQKLSEIGVK